MGSFKNHSRITKNASTFVRVRIHARTKHMYSPRIPYDRALLYSIKNCIRVEFRYDYNCLKYIKQKKLL